MKKDNITPETPKQESAPKKKSSLLGTVAKLFTAAAVILVLFWFGFTTVVREGSCAVILRFGAVREEITDAGVYLKLPWPFESVVTYDNRTQYLESNKLETTTADKRNIMLQSYVTWRIDDPVKYHNSVGTTGSAQTFIKGAVDSATNKTLGTYSLSQLVSLESEQIRIEQIQQEIYQSVHDVCFDNYGIQISDVSILRISLPDTNLESVFQQMTADRQKEIDKILADARLEATKITTEAAQQSSEIIAQGVKEATQQAVISTVNDNYDDVYHAVREGYAAGWYPDGAGRWDESVDTGDVYGQLSETLGLENSGRGYQKITGGEVEYTISGLSVELDNNSLSSGQSEGYTAVVDKQRSHFFFSPFLAYDRVCLRADSFSMPASRSLCAYSR